MEEVLDNVPEDAEVEEAFRSGCDSLVLEKSKKIKVGFVMVCVLFKYCIAF